MKKIYLFVAFWTGSLSGCADNRFGYLHMDPEPAKLQMDVTLNRLQGLLQQDRAVDEGVSYQLRFLYAYGRTVEIRVQAPETWGVRFANGTYTLPQGSGIAFNEEAAPQTLSIPVVAGEDSKPLLAGSMPVSITVLDPQGEVLLSEQSTIQVFSRDEVFTTVGELNERWRLSLGDALIYDPQHPNDNQGNRAVVYASLDASKDVEVVEDFGGTGLKGIRIRRGQTLSTALLAWREYVIATDDCAGFFYWSPDWAIADGESPAYDPSGGVPGRIYDFETGEVEDSAVGSVCVSGTNAKDVNNRTSNYNSPTNIIAGVGDERIVNLVPSTTTWYYKGEGRSVLNETGRYLVQWNLLDRKPDVNGADRLLNKAVSNNNLWLIGAESVFNRAGVYVCQWDLIDKNVTPSVVTGKLRIVVVAVEDGEF